MNYTKNKKQSKIKDITILFGGLQIEQCTIVPELRPTVKWNLKRIIGKSGMKQDEVAEKLGWYSSYLSKLINGNAKFPFIHLVELSELLGVTVDEFFLQ